MVDAVQNQLKVGLSSEAKERLKAAVYLFWIYAAMLAGMAAKTWFDHLANGDPFNFSKFYIPFVISPIVFNAFLHIVKSSLDPLPTTLISFQNGFFWQDDMSNISIETGQT